MKGHSCYNFQSNYSMHNNVNRLIKIETTWSSGMQENKFTMAQCAYSKRMKIHTDAKEHTFKMWIHVYLSFRQCWKHNTEKTAKILIWTWPQQKQTNPKTSLLNFCSIGQSSLAKESIPDDWVQCRTKIASVISISRFSPPNVPFCHLRWEAVLHASYCIS